MKFLWRAQGTEKSVWKKMEKWAQWQCLISFKTGWSIMATVFSTGSNFSTYTSRAHAGLWDYSTDPKSQTQQKWTYLCTQGWAVWKSHVTELVERGKKVPGSGENLGKLEQNKDHTSEAEQQEGWLESWASCLCFGINSSTHWRKRTWEAAVVNIIFLSLGIIPVASD